MLSSFYSVTIPVEGIKCFTCYSWQVAGPYLKKIIHLTILLGTKTDWLWTLKSSALSIPTYIANKIVIFIHKTLRLILSKLFYFIWHPDFKMMGLKLCYTLSLVTVDREEISLPSICISCVFNLNTEWNYLLNNSHIFVGYV